MASLTIVATLTFALNLTFALVGGFDQHFKNIYKQTTTEVQNYLVGDLVGRVPAWLDGDFVRQNCASFGDIDGAKYEYVEHLFDCIPMVGRYHIEKGQVRYSNKQYATRPNGIWKSYNHNMTKSQVRWLTLFSDINVTAYMETRNTPFNATLPLSPTVNFWRSRPEDPVFAVTESVFSPTELTLRPELKVGGWYNPKFKDSNFPGSFARGNSVHRFNDNPAHEQNDADGTIWVSTMEIEPPISSGSKNKTSGLELAILVYSIKGNNRTMAARHLLGKYSVTNCSSLTKEEKDIMPGYTHFIQTTSNYILVPQTSYRYDYCLDYEIGKNVKPGFLKSYKWHPEVNTSILIFERNNMSKVHHVYMPFAKFFTHDINAFEDATHIFLDTLAYDNADAYLRVPVIKEALANFNWTTSFLRIAIDKRTWTYDAAKTRPLTAADPFGKAEFPMINYEGYHQNDYTFVYFVANALYQDAKIAKLNVKTKQVTYWIPPLGYYPQEPIFVPSPGATKEDEGVILCSGPISNPPGTSFLMILNATDLKQIALLKNPNAAPLGLHNRFYKNPAKQTTTTTTHAPTTTKASSQAFNTTVQSHTTPGGSGNVNSYRPTILVSALILASFFFH